MNRETLTDKDIVQFLQYHNRPNEFGIYRRIQGGSYPVYKLNMEEHQLWLMMADFFATFLIDNMNFSHDTDFFRTAIKKSWTEKLRHRLQRARVRDMTIAFLTATARRGVWDESIKDVGTQHTGGHSTG